MKKIKHIIAIFLVLFTVATPVTASAMPWTQFGAACKNQPVLTLPSWYKGLQCDGGVPQITDINDVWVIALNIVEMLIGVTAYVAAGYIIWGGFKYIKARGDPGKLAEAKMTITYAVMGLGIALAATAIVVFVQGIFT